MGDHLTLKTTNMKKMTLINNRLVAILFELNPILYKCQIQHLLQGLYIMKLNAFYKTRVY